MTHPSRFELDRLAAGEAVSEIAAHVGACVDCRRYIEGREAEQQALLEKMPAARFFGNLERRVSAPASARRYGWWVGWAAAAAAASIAILLWHFGDGTVVSSGADSVADASSEEMRWMGGSAPVRVFVKRGPRVFALDDERLLSGDSVRFEITPRANTIGYAAVAAVEHGNVAMVLPGATTKAARITGRTLLPGSVDLDADAADTELLLVVRTAPFELTSLAAEIQEVLRTRRDLGAVEGLTFRVKVAE